MKLLKHFSMFGKANTYIVGPDNGGDAILIDPAIMDIHMLELIENNNFYVKHILITHAHKHHFAALKTIKKIYNAEIYSYYSHIGDFESNSLVDGEVLILSDLEVKVLHVPGHSSDSLIYQIGNYLFVGDVITAGLLGKTDSKFEEEILIDSIETKLLTLDDHSLVFPGHGPPSILISEKKMFNLYAPLK
ncbi:MBL fold metallo-hydrolase [Thiospirochaeta perfilievii]|uniref:MBL fold metallo-hydrolase n=1 Tax=Thiospirochaeta perfilievii TaxID=252967 RepID=A0A5C1QEI2_9SPIO|nr:MBL fold metallo-hydrolase [Thiospirochaeta perfilievii]QEN05788.1 MBL fold metallo-hydrolase [Thiospirochaeta perfilievii]